MESVREGAYQCIGVAVFVENLRRPLDPLQWRRQHEVCLGGAPDKRIRWWSL